MQERLVNVVAGVVYAVDTAVDMVVVVVVVMVEVDMVEVVVEDIAVYLFGTVQLPYYVTLYLFVCVNNAHLYVGNKLKKFGYRPNIPLIYCTELVDADMFLD